MRVVRTSHPSRPFVFLAATSCSSAFGCKRSLRRDAPPIMSCMCALLSCRVLDMGIECSLLLKIICIPEPFLAMIAWRVSLLWLETAVRSRGVLPLDCLHSLCLGLVPAPGCSACVHWLLNASAEAGMTCSASASSFGVLIVEGASGEDMRSPTVREACDNLAGAVEFNGLRCVCTPCEQLTVPPEVCDTVGRGQSAFRRLFDVEGLLLAAGFVFAFGPSTWVLCWACAAAARRCVSSSPTPGC